MMHHQRPKRKNERNGGKKKEKSGEKYEPMAKYPFYIFSFRGLPKPVCAITEVKPSVG